MSSLRVLRVLTGGVIIIFVMIFSSHPGFAMVLRSGDTITIESNEVINEDLYLAGDTIVVDGTVNGDLWAAGKNVTINGRVANSVYAFANRVVVLGDVGRGVKAFGKSVRIAGNVDGDLVVAGKEIKIDSNAKIQGDILFGARAVFFDGPVGGSILGGGSEITMNSGVMGDVRFGVKDLILTNMAHIGGDLTYFSENEASIGSGAKIDGFTTHRLPECPGYKDKLKKIFPFVLLARTVRKSIGFFMALIVGLVFILLTPKWMESLINSLQKKPGPCAGWGALILFAVPPGILIALITVVGIPLAVITLFLYLTAVYISQIIVSLFIGRLIISRGSNMDTKALMFGVFTLGLFIISLLRFIPVFGYIVSIVVILFGLGAIVVTEGTRRGVA